MSQVLLLLTLSVVGFPPLESFLFAPATNSAAWVNQRRQHVSYSDSSSSIYRSGEVCLRGDYRDVAYSIDDLG